MTDLAVKDIAEARLADELAAALTEALQKLADAENKIANLEVALASNRRIGVAIGILMATMKVTDEQAFDILRVGSQNTHRKLRDLADEVVFTGALGFG